ncbi:hypothetical protein CRM22_010636 [Opisthorchis felineus]|uniref:Uncharacterized protein n=1 Tax=Opisthorchis felineus TaxID=147828 RepID=A0A4S2KVY0_OPIFE|nr:hypothetical protein CRM22_010636 [Opisthorchis felineus]
MVSTSLWTILLSLALLRFSNGNTVKTLAFDVAFKQPGDTSGRWTYFFEDWSVQNISHHDVCFGFHQMKKQLTDRFRQFPFLFCGSTSKGQAAVKLYFDASNLDTQRLSMDCHAKDLESILNHRISASSQHLVSVTAPTSTTTIYVTTMNVARHPNRATNFWTADEQLRKEITENAITVSPIAIFGESTENVFNENYFAVFEEAKLPSAGWAPPSRWEDRLNEFFYVGEYLFGIKSWYVTDTTSLQEREPPESQRNCQASTMNHVSMIPVTVRMSDTKIPWDVLSHTFKITRWEISRGEQVTVGMHATLDLVEGALIHGRVFDTAPGKVKRITAKFALEGLSLQSVDLEAIKVLKCEEHLDAYSLKASFKFFIPVGNQRLLAKNLPKAHSAEYDNIIEFSDIFLREDLLRELHLHTAVLAVHVSDLVVSGSYIMACGTVNFKTTQLLNTLTDLDQENLVESFNQKFEGDEILKIQALHIEDRVLVCGKSSTQDTDDSDTTA